MSSKLPKTGLAKQMRAWMRNRKRSFRMADLCQDLGIPEGEKRFTIYRALQDFERRGEVIRLQRNLRQNLFRYNHVWKSAPKGKHTPRILKAMRVVSFKEPFATSDIERLTKAGKNHIGKLTHRLHRAFLKGMKKQRFFNYF